jgi:hypothetical protein
MDSRESLSYSEPADKNKSKSAATEESKDSDKKTQASSNQGDSVGYSDKTPENNKNSKDTKKN